jgi:2-oxoglutarate dehydrogenase E1 component
MHPLVKAVINNWQRMGEGELPLDWGLAENLAYASLLENGFGVRVSGMDSGRGTFWHRQAIWYDQNKDQVERKSYVPLRNLSPEQPKFTVIDSLLSEEAVLGFEYGYSITEPHQLVVWEAQYGDFVNGAQVIIDQFITTGETKWGYLSGLVIMLPHGYEGVGPEHSSAHLGRFLQLCAEENIQVCFPSTPAQLFHMLRRQMLRPIRKPLIVMTPKSQFHSLKEAHSPLSDFTEGTFKPIIGEIDELDNKQVKRVVMCSGKVYYDLLAARHAKNIKNIALVRIEQLYPFPHQQLTAELERYPNAKELVWAQEETKNHGAWYPLQDYLLMHKKYNQLLNYVGRDSAAASAICDKKEHLAQQEALINAALS